MKKRIDQLLVEKGLVESRTRAQGLIMAGLVFIGTLRIDKPGQQVAEDADITVKGREHPYVSRGGLKLAGALDHQALDVAGMIALDIGASTGGFTDVLLQRHAKKVFAVDVGTNQLAWKLRNDARVISLEQTNARMLDAEIIPIAPDIVVCDASFISLKTVLPAGLSLAKTGAWLVALIKPQFEVGRDHIGKGGIVRDDALHEATCADIKNWLQHEMRWNVQALIDSPITGADGNKEFLIIARKTD